MATIGGDAIRYSGPRCVSEVRYHPDFGPHNDLSSFDKYLMMLFSNTVLGTNGDKLKLEVFIEKCMRNVFKGMPFELNMLEGEVVGENRCQDLDQGFHCSGSAVYIGCMFFCSVQGVC